MQCIPIPSAPHSALGTRHPVHRTADPRGDRMRFRRSEPRLNVAEKFFDIMVNARTPLPASRPSASRTWSLFTALASVTRRNLIAMHGCAAPQSARGGRQRCLHAHYVRGLGGIDRRWVGAKGLLAAGWLRYRPAVAPAAAGQARRAATASCNCRARRVRGCCLLRCRAPARVVWPRGRGRGLRQWGL
jgi:hypothetical protein